MQNGPGPGTKRTGTGENKNWNSGSGKSTPPQKAKEYHKNPVTGELEEYKGVDYIDDKSKKTKSPLPTPPVPADTTARPSFIHRDVPHHQYADELFNHTIGKEKPKGKPIVKNGGTFK